MYPKSMQVPKDFDLTFSFLLVISNTYILFNLVRGNYIDRNALRAILIAKKAPEKSKGFGAFGGLKLNLINW